MTGVRTTTDVVLGPGMFIFDSFIMFSNLFLISRYYILMTNDGLWAMGDELRGMGRDND